MLLLFETAAGFALFKVNKEDKLEKADVRTIRGFTSKCSRRPKAETVCLPLQDLYKDFETLDSAKKVSLLLLWNASCHHHCLLDYLSSNWVLQVVKLKAFSKFENTTEALAAATALVESKLSKGELLQEPQIS